MPILNIAGYKFTFLCDLKNLRALFLQTCTELELKGTVLLSEEGININLSGLAESIEVFKTFLKNDIRFADISFRQSYSTAQSFKRLKVKLKREIITFRQEEANPLTHRAQSIAPETLKQWLDEKRAVTLLDVRNDFEIEFGTFTDAINLHLKSFTDFSQASATLQTDQPIVMFCTGGIRCEKAALFMLKQGHTNIFQLEGGILNYFAKTNGEHYEGECYVFDERVTVNKTLGSVYNSFALAKKRGIETN